MATKNETPGKTIRLPAVIREHLLILADREHVTESDVIREAIEALLTANPISDIDRARFRKTKTQGVRRTNLKRPSGPKASLTLALERVRRGWDWNSVLDIRLAERPQRRRGASRRAA